jgi:hypothetical protein
MPTASTSQTLPSVSQTTQCLMNLNTQYYENLKPPLSYSFTTATLSTLNIQASALHVYVKLSISVFTLTLHLGVPVETQCRPLCSYYRTAGAVCHWDMIKSTAMHAIMFL